MHIGAAVVVVVGAAVVVVVGAAVVVVVGAAVVVGPLLVVVGQQHKQLQTFAATQVKVNPLMQSPVIVQEPLDGEAHGKFHVIWNVPGSGSVH